MTAVDVDEVAVERACMGDRTVSLNRAEAAEAFRLLDQRGLSANQIADVLGTTARTVQRWRDGDTSPITRAGAVTVDHTREKISAALQSRVPAVRRAATKAEAALTALDQVIAEWDAKEQALERIAELEAELAEAKAKLRGPAKPAMTKPGPGVHSLARAWARQQGITVPSKGLVPAEIVEAYHQATAA